MDDLKLKVGIARFPYGGNGMSQSEHPDVGDWLSRTIEKIKSDDRIELTDGKVPVFRIADTPITMTRNRAVKMARSMNLDILVMIDSDMKPDTRLKKDKNAEDFWTSSFDFIYNNWKKNKYYAVAAPYCGGGDDHCPFIFKWAAKTNREHSEAFGLEMYSREEAAEWTGIAPVAALPTGLIAFAMPLFKLTETENVTDEQISKLCSMFQSNAISSEEFAGELTRDSWFYYEYGDPEQTCKLSTEDVTATRDMSLKGLKEWGYNPLMCNWNAWAGHWKPELVDKPIVTPPEFISRKLVEIAERRLPSTIKNTYLHYDGPMPEDTPTSQETVEEMEETQEMETVSTPKPSTNGVVKKMEARVERDEMEDPPISDSIMTDLASTVEMIATIRRGDALNCMVIGEYTGMLANVISDSFSGAGGRVLCLGDCVDSDGHPLQSWLEYVGERFQETVWPVKGDTVDSFQGIDRELDLVLLSTCGVYSEMASLISRWTGLVRPGGIICGTQLDEGSYPATVQAIYEIFGKDRVETLGGSFWFSTIDSVRIES